MKRAAFIFLLLCASVAGPTQSVAARDKFHFDLVCDVKVMAGKIRYGGTGAAPGYDEYALHHYRIAIDLKRKLFDEYANPKFYSDGSKLDAFDDESITLSNIKGRMAVWDRKNGRYYSVYDNYDNSVVVYGGVCKVGNYTPFGKP